MRDGFICSEFNARTSVERDGISWDCNLKDMAILTTRRRVSAERTFDSHRSDSHRNALLVTCYNGLRIMNADGRLVIWWDDSFGALTSELFFNTSHLSFCLFCHSFFCYILFLGVCYIIGFYNRHKSALARNNFQYFDQVLRTEFQN